MDDVGYPEGCKLGAELAVGTSVGAGLLDGRCDVLGAIDGLNESDGWSLNDG